MRIHRSSISLLVAIGVLVGACGSDDLERSQPAETTHGFLPGLFDPTDESGVDLDDYRKALPRDAINPVYDPAFVKPALVDWSDDALIIGVDLNGEQRAYPVGFLTFREIVIDDHRGIPTMVTW